MNNKLKLAINITQIIGSVVSPILSGIAGSKYSKKIETLYLEKVSNDEELTRKDKIKLGIKVFLPTFISTAITTTCALVGMSVNKKDINNLTAALALTSASLYDYTSKNIEVNGIEAHDKVLEALHAEKAKKTFITSSTFSDICNLIQENESKETKLFYEPLTDRYFESTLADVINAEYHINRNLSLGAFVTLNVYLDFLGLSSVDGGDDIGWDLGYLDGIYWLDFNHRHVDLEVTDDNCSLECICIETVFSPISEEEAENHTGYFDI